MSELDKNVEAESQEKEVVSKNFIETEIDKDLAEGVYDTVHTRFPAVSSICVLMIPILQRRR